MKVRNTEHIVILYDDTVFGGSREGFLVTNGGIYAKELFEDPVCFSWENIKSISFNEGELIINNIKISIPTASDKQFAKMLSRAFAKLIS